MHSCQYDQSAYISYLVDEAVREVETSKETTPAVFNPAPSSSVLPPYPVANYHNQNTGVLCSQTDSNGDFEEALGLPAQGYIQFRSSGHQYFPENPDSPAYHTSSFCLDQNIGLNQAPVVNASQLNNKIQVQYQFSDGDRFSVQATNFAQPGIPSFNWKPLNIDVPSNLVNGEKHNANKVYQADNNKNLPNSDLISRPRDTGDFSQFLVEKIIEKNPSVFERTVNKETIQNKAVKNFDLKTAKKKYLNPAIKEKLKERLKQKKQSLDLFSCAEKDRAKAAGQNSQDKNNKLVSLQSVRVFSAELVNKPSITKEVKTADIGQQTYRCTSDGAEGCVDLSVNNSTLEDRPDYHRASEEYFKQYIEFVKKQKARAVFEDEDLKETVVQKSSFTEVTDDEKILNLSYQCRECSKTCSNINELKKHIGKSHNNEKKKRKEYERKNQKVKDKCMLDLVGSIEADELNMANENEEMEIVPSEKENDDMEPQSYLCFYCGLSSKTMTESEEHLRTHADEKQSEETGKVCHGEEREYLQRSNELVEIRKMKEQIEEKVTEERKEEKLINEEEKKAEEASDLAKLTSQLRPCLKKMASLKEVDINILKESLEDHSSHQEEPRNLPKRQAATQAKNNLMNPSKGKQKRVREMHDLNREDKMLMKMFGIIPSEVCLSRVKKLEKLECQNESTDHKSDISREVQESRKSPRKRNTFSNEWSKVISMSSNEMEIKEDLGSANKNVFSDDDSDVELVEPPKTVIVLDDDNDGFLKTQDSPRKSDKEIMKAFGIKDVAIKLNKTGNMSDKKSPDQMKKSSKSDCGLLEKNDSENPSISQTHSQRKVRKTRIGPKSKTQKKREQVEGDKSLSCVNNADTDFEELTPEEIEKMLHECGMGIVVPASKESIEVKDRTPSPVPSTSKGHGHLKRKRTARKSTKDSALFEKYKLKDSKVILKSLSRIDVSMLRNPNSPFGKSDWLKHKFDSDTESDFEFDIPTPPLEDFVENTGSARFEGKEKTVQSSMIHVRKSPVKMEDQKIMEKFGIVDSVVVVDSPLKNKNVSPERSNKKPLSDEELRKKFGIPSTVVVIDSSNKSSEKKDQSEINSSKTKSVISFAEFRLALDKARKNVLSRLKNDSGLDVNGTGNNDINVEKDRFKEIAQNTRRKTSLTLEENIQPAKKLKFESKNKSDVKTRSRCVKKEYKQTNDRKDPVDDEASGLRNSANKILKKVLPGKQGKVSVNLQRLKLNEALKRYKAKAVSPASEVGQKKKGNTLKVKDREIRMATETPVLAKRKLRHRGITDILEVPAKKRKDIKLNRKENTQEKERKKDKPVVKTARYRRSLDKEHHPKDDGNSNNLEAIAKGLPVVKVSVPCLSTDDIFKLSQNINPVEKVDSLTDADTKKMVKEVIDEIIDKVCCPEQMLAETCQPFNVSNKKYNNSPTSEVGVGKELVVEDCPRKSIETAEDVSINGAKDSDYSSDVSENERNYGNSEGKGKNEALEKRNENDGNEKKGAMSEEFSTEDTESDLSLISLISEKQENENESFTSKGSNINFPGGDSMIGDNDEYATKDSEKTCIADIETIPLGSSKFYEDCEKEDAYDEIDGNIEEESTLSVNVIDVKVVEISDCSVEETSLSNECELDSCSDELSVKDVIEKIESQFEKQNDFFENELSPYLLNETESAGNQNFDASLTVNNDENENEGTRILTPIFDSDSGSKIGDVYTVDEAAKMAKHESGDKEIKHSDIQKESLQDICQSQEASVDNTNSLLED